jgi:DNA-binding Lrp family transcriptional regulator
MSLTELERKFINQYQGGFPVLEQPFRLVAADLGCSENALLDSIRHLLDTGILSRFGPLYDAVKLGGGLTLAAISVPEEQFDYVTALINEFPEVAHNYRREHDLNMWFVLATESPESIDKTLNRIEQATGLKVYHFPKQEEFYVGLWLALDADDKVTTVPVPAAIAATRQSAPADGHRTADELDRKIINASQAGLQLVDCPYGMIAEDAGCTSQEVKQRLQNMLANGIIRRIGAVPNHYNLGLKANGMTVWDVPDEQARELGAQIGQLDFVSHCYLRPRHLPVWRYNLFAMVHGHTRDEVDAKAETIASILDDKCNAHETLFSTAVLKKTGMRLAA